jgi:hypothetical protein
LIPTPDEDRTTELDVGPGDGLVVFDALVC